jgi:RNA polymerase sigma factor (sigma-70 family)
MTAPRQPSIAFDADALLAHGAWLAKLARALVVRDDEIDDVVQQTFAQALAQPPRHTGNVRGWLATIARNVVRSRARSETARAARERVAAPPSAVDDPADAVARAELQRRVVGSVLDLDEPYRSTIILRFFEEMDVGAIGRLTNSGEETVRTRIRRGVIRVREKLERGSTEESRGAADRGAAARALLFTQLRRMATTTPAAGAGSVVAPGSVARDVARAGRSAASSATRRILVGAATVAVVAGGWWWREAARSRPKGPETEVADRSAPAVAPTGTDRPAGEVAAERSSEAAPSPATERPPAPEGFDLPPLGTGSFRGVVTDPDGNVVPHARVWAIAVPSHELDMEVEDWGQSANNVADREAKHREVTNWFGTWSDENGRYEVAGLTEIPAWAVGAFEPTLGAVVSGVHSFDHEHARIDVDLALIAGRIIFGLVRDPSLTPIGNATIRLYASHGGRTTTTSLLALPVGPDVGAFDFGFRCGEPLEFDCSAPGYLPGKRHKIEFGPHQSGVNLVVTLRREPGSVVRGRIVDPNGHLMPLDTFLMELLTTSTSDVQPGMITVRAIPVADGASAAGGPVEGRIDFVHRMYDLVLPESFRGRIELAITGTVVGSAALDDVARPPDLPCDPGRLPKKDAPTTFEVSFVDAETKQPIDLEGLEHPPRAYYGAGIQAIARGPGSDPRRGIVSYGCTPGELTLEALVKGHAPGRFVTTVPETKQPQPYVVELLPDRGGVEGVVQHADGKPFRKARLTLYRATPDGWVDESGMVTFSNPDGRFLFPSVAKGDHVIVASGLPDEAPAVARFVVEDSAPKIRLRCSPGTSTVFRVNASPQPATPPETRFLVVDRSGVVLDDTRRAWPPAVLSRNDWTTVLPDGRYSVVVDRRGCREAKVDFDVPAGGEVVIPLEPAAAASGAAGH